MKKAFTILLLGISFQVISQGTQTTGTATEVLDVTNIKPTFLSDGDLFHDLQNNNPQIPNWYNQGFEVPRGSGKHTMFSGALWIGGKDATGQLYVSQQTYRQGTPPEAGYWPGPIGNVHNPAHTAKYDKLWKVSKTEIQQHIANYKKPGYTMPTAIATWPGNGNAANGEAARLAPFADLNNDGLYSPNQGEYPVIKGDQAIYLILNDKGNVKKPASPTMNAEIHVMHYGFDNPLDTAVFHTLFTEYRIVNRGTLNLEDFYAGIWTDFDLGYYDDDFVGCDTLTNRFFVYNGDNYDDDTTFIKQTGYGPVMVIPNGYGANPPMQSVAFLDQKMSHFIYYTNDANPRNGNPTRATDFYNYMSGFWRDGAKLTQWGEGTNQNNPPASYMFPGFPGSNDWTESHSLPIPSSSNTPSDRRGLGSIGPFNLNAGQELKFTVAYTYTRAPNAMFVCNLGVQNAQTVQNFFNRNFTLGTSESIAENQTFKLYPNPATDLLQIQLPNTFENRAAIIAITDYTGRTVLQTATKNTNQQLNISTLSKGIYQVTVTSEKQTLTSRLVKL